VPISNTGGVEDHADNDECGGVSLTQLCTPRGEGYARFTAIIDRFTKTAKLLFNIRYSKTSEKVVGVTIRGPDRSLSLRAPVQIDAGRIFKDSNPSSNLSSYVVGETVLSREQTYDLLKGFYFIRVDTDKFRKGELFGFIQCASC